MCTQAVQAMVSSLVENDDRSWGILKLDVKNAFNSLLRTKMLPQIHNRAPALYPWMALAYGRHSPLFCGPQQITSECGLQQGDPLGPLGFALGIQQVLEDLKPLVSWQMWYLDDGLLVGNRAQLNDAMALVNSRFAELGLQINVSKCELWGPLAGPSPTNDHLRGVRRIALDTGISVLGGPVDLPNKEGQTAAVWLHRLHDMARSLKALEDFPQLHIQYSLLRSCLDACKVSDLLRVSHFSKARPRVEACTRLCRATLQRILGTALTEAQWVQASMPIRHGGMGITDANFAHLPARLACASDFVTRGRSLMALPDAVSLLPKDAGILLSAAVGLLGNVAPLDSWMDGDRPFFASHADWCNQTKWTDRLVRTSVDALLASASARDKVRMTAQQSPHAGAWLAAYPSASQGTLFLSQEFRRAGRWWLGVAQVGSDAIGITCPKCSAPMDIHGDHAVCCSQNLIQRRHASLQNVLEALILELGLSVDKEVGPGDGSRPGDLYIPNWNATGVTVDCTVRHPLAPSRRLLDPHVLGDWRAAQEKEKADKYTERCVNAGWVFVPFLMDLWCGLGPSAGAFMRQYSTFALAAEPAQQKRTVEGTIWQRLTATVMQQIGRQLTVFDALSGPPDASLIEKA